MLIITPYLFFLTLKIILNTNYLASNQFNIFEKINLIHVLCLLSLLSLIHIFSYRPLRPSEHYYSLIIQKPVFKKIKTAIFSNIIPHIWYYHNSHTQIIDTSPTHPHYVGHFLNLSLQIEHQMLQTSFFDQSQANNRNINKSPQ